MWASVRVVLDHPVAVLQFIAFLHGKARMNSLEVSSPQTLKCVGWMVSTLGICFMVIGGRLDRNVPSWRAEHWFQKILVVYNLNVDMKREDCEIFMGMDVDVIALHIRLKRRIDHRLCKLQHGCIGKSYTEKCFVFAGQGFAILNRILGHDCHASLGQFIVHVRLFGYTSRLISSSAMRFAKRRACLRARCLKAMRCLKSG